MSIALSFLLWALQFVKVELPDASLGNLKIQKQRSSGATPVLGFLSFVALGIAIAPIPHNPRRELRKLSD